MIGTNEYGTRVLFSQGKIRHNYGLMADIDYKPVIYSGDHWVYVELRCHERDYVLEICTRENNVNKTVWQIMNDFDETEAEKVRKAIFL